MRGGRRGDTGRRTHARVATRTFENVCTLIQRGTAPRSSQRRSPRATEGSGHEESGPCPEPRLALAPPRHRPRRPTRRRVEGDRWRITVLTDGLLRIEWADDGVFEDRATAFALRRDLPVPTSGSSTADPGDRHRAAPPDLRPAGLHPVGAERAGPGEHLGVPLDLALRRGRKEGEGGTARTLDDVDGRIPLEPGIVSRWGYAVLDDSASPVLEDDGWVSPRDGSSTTSTCSPTATTTPRRSRRSTRCPARSRCCRGGRWATGGAATSRTRRTSTSR